MKEEYWLKYGFKENGELTCVRTIATSKPTEKFFYTEEGQCKEAKNCNVVLLTGKTIEGLKNSSIMGADKK